MFTPHVSFKCLSTPSFYILAVHLYSICMIHILNTKFHMFHLVTYLTNSGHMFTPHVSFKCLFNAIIPHLSGAPIFHV